MTYEENIKAILESYFPGHKEEIIKSACDRIVQQNSKPEECNVMLLKECSAHPELYNKVSNILYKDFGLHSAEVSLTCTHVLLKMMEG